MNERPGTTVPAIYLIEIVQAPPLDRSRRGEVEQIAQLAHTLLASGVPVAELVRRLAAYRDQPGDRV